MSSIFIGPQTAEGWTLKMAEANWQRGIRRLCVVVSAIWVVAAFVSSVYARINPRGIAHPFPERLYDLATDGLWLSSPVWIAWICSYTARWVTRGFRSQVPEASGAEHRRTFISRQTRESPFMRFRDRLWRSWRAALFGLTVASLPL